PGALTTHHSVIHEWDIDPFNPDTVDPTSAREVLRIGQPYTDHNVGQIAFNPNANSGDPDYGLLYVAMGDGGNVCCPRPSVDPHFTGQDRSSPLGALLRIDPSADAGGAAYQIPTGNPFATDGDPDTLGEIYLYGLRNPHRFSWDTGGNGGLMISDIGQANIEEINLGQLGANYGWSEREGTFLVVHDNENDVFDLPADDTTFGFTYPVIQYDHDEDDHAISGGYVYRGSQISTLLGEYVFGDLVSGRVFFAPAASLDGTGQVAFEELRLIDAADGLEKSLLAIIGGGTPASRADLRFGTDDDGEIYLVTKQDGSIRLLSAPPCSGGPACADDTVSVSDISVQLETIGRKHTRASAVVTIVDETGALIEGATVHGRWSSLVDQSQSDVTDVLGEAIFRSSKVSNSLVGEFVFAVTDVVVSGLVYDPGANVETSACINTDGDLCSTGSGEPTALHVSGITVTLSNRGKNWYGEATVTVLDTSSTPASDAVVAGLWTHEPLGGAPNDLNQVAGNTDASGQLTTTSSKLRASSGDGFRFTVDNVTRGSDTYNPGASVQDKVAYVP
ncbi:MAG: sorbosone dehydrogenase family protein, partial [Rhodothermales bacterium]